MKDKERLDGIMRNLDSDEREQVIFFIKTNPSWLELGIFIGSIYEKRKFGFFSDEIDSLMRLWGKK